MYPYYFLVDSLMRIFHFLVICGFAIMSPIVFDNQPRSVLAHADLFACAAQPFACSPKVALLVWDNGRVFVCFCSSHHLRFQRELCGFILVDPPYLRSGSNWLRTSKHLCRCSFVWFRGSHYLFFRFARH